MTFVHMNKLSNNGEISNLLPTYNLEKQSKRYRNLIRSSYRFLRIEWSQDAVLTKSDHSLILLKFNHKLMTTYEFHKLMNGDIIVNIQNLFIAQAI